MTAKILIEKQYQVMGGQFIFSCYDSSENSTNVNKLFDLAFSEVLRIENKFTDFKPSYFNRINEQAGKSEVSIDDETLHLIELSLSLFKKSQGLFDISFASLGHLWRQHQKEGKKIPDHIIEENKKYINSDLIQLNREAKKIFLPYPQMRIGLGGIGKGYAVDQVFNILKANNLSNFCINGAGDIRVHSDLNAKRKWQIGIKNPFAPNTNKAIGIIQLSNGAVATSGGYVKNVNNDISDHHIINPKSGRSSSEIVQSTIISDSAINADTMATIIINQNPNEAIDFMNAHKICGLFIDRDGHSHLSEMAQDFFSSPQ